jgi:hypothetical protein
MLILKKKIHRTEGGQKRARLYLERDSENKYAVDNEDSEWKIYLAYVLILMEI